MQKKLSAKTNFILIGIIVGLFVGVSIRQAWGDTNVPGTARADNLTVNMSANTENGLAVANGNLLVPNGNIGIGTTTPTTSLDVVGDIKTTGSIKSNNLCIGATCINETQLKTLLAVGGTGTGGTGGTVTPGTMTGTETGGTGGTVTPGTMTGTETGSTGGTASAPTITSFTASPASITPGQSTTLSWTSTGADIGNNSCALNINDNGRSLGNKPANSSFAVSPAVTTTYILTCSKYNPTTGINLNSKTAHVTVTVGGTGSSTYTLTVSRTGIATWDGTVTVTATDTNDIVCGPTQSTCSHSYASGSLVTLTASPEPGYEFVAWWDGMGYEPDGCSRTNTVCTVIMSQDKIIVPEFFAQPIVLNISGTTLSWDSPAKPTSCQYRVDFGAWRNLSPLTGTLSLLGLGLSVGTTYTINARCFLSSHSSSSDSLPYGPASSVTYTPTK